MQKRSKKRLTFDEKFCIISRPKFIGSFCDPKNEGNQRGVAQLVEHRSPKPRVVGSNPAAPAIK